MHELLHINPEHLCLFLFVCSCYGDVALTNLMPLQLCSQMVCGLS